MPLKNRVRFNTVVDKELDKKFRELADETRIPMSRLMDEAIEDLLIKHGKLEKEKEDK